jgi:uncharacterized Zn finger protein
VRGSRRGKPARAEGLRDFLARQEKEHLVDLLFDHALLDDRLLQKRAYEIAVARLKQVRDVMNLLGKTRELAAYLAAVRLAHKRKRNFLKLLDGAKLG